MSELYITKRDNFLNIYSNAQFRVNGKLYVINSDEIININDIKNIKVLEGQTRIQGAYYNTIRIIIYITKTFKDVLFQLPFDDVKDKKLINRTIIDIMTGKLVKETNLLPFNKARAVVQPPVAGASACSNTRVEQSLLENHSQQCTLPKILGHSSIECDREQQNPSAPSIPITRENSGLSTQLKDSSFI